MQQKSIIGLVTTDTYVYDDVNRLTSVNAVNYAWDNNGNLLNDGVNAYTYNTANQLKTLTGPSVNASYAYNGMGDRLQEVHNGGTTNFMMDYNMGLTQVLNDGTTTSRTTPVNVSGLTSGVVAITAGASHTCALTTAGGVKCWGNNWYGQLGDGTTTSRMTPVNVSGLTSGVSAITAGYRHICALTTSGGVKCWGANWYGQLGDGTTTDHLTPANVSGLTSGVTAIAAGVEHTCALTSSGGIKCWGSNTNGQLGDGTTTNRTAPVNVSGLTTGMAAVDAGNFHTCALTSSAGIKCWGNNFSGQLGDGTTTQRLTPVEVGGLTSGVSAVSGGGGHTCALTTGGGVLCWGSNNFGELGDGTTTRRSTPAYVSGLTGMPAPTATPTATLTPTFTPTPTATSIPSGPVTINYVYDPLYRLKEANYSNGDYYHYSYDAVGNRKTQQSMIGGLLSTDSYNYDDANRLTDVNGVLYTWDNNGNLLSDGVNAYAYDAANRMLSSNGGGINAAYTYNGLDDRLQQIVNGNTTTYVLDLNAGLTQVLNDGENAYLYGIDRIAQVNTSTEYFLGDALGSVRQLTNAQGNITLTKSYAPYGEVMASAGSGTSPFAYTGEQMDVNGLTYLRARYYASSAGRFLTRDTWAGNYNQPLTLNRWIYTNANPINWIDPSGRITENDNIAALIIAEDLRIRFNVKITVDWGYISWVPIQVYGLPIPTTSDCEWHYGYWRNLHELELVRDGVERLAKKMGSPEKFKSAMKNRPVEITRVSTLLPPFTNNTGLALPEIPIYFMVDGLMLPDGAFDSGDIFATYTTIHELGHVWDIRSNLSLSINMALHLGNTQFPNSLFGCLVGPADPKLRFACAMSNWKYDGVNNEPAPGNPTKPYASYSIAEDWAEAVAYTTYGTEYGKIHPSFNKISAIRQIYVEMMMRDLH